MGENYFIITTDRLKDSLAEFAATKRSKGYSVQLLTCDQVRAAGPGTDTFSDSLRQFLRRQIDKSGAAGPGFLLLVGDYDSIPGYPLAWGDLHYESDSYYSIFEDSQVVPLLATGRISTNDADEVENICEMLMNYPHQEMDECLKKIIMTGFIPRGLDATDCYYWEDAGWQCLKEIDLSHYKAVLRLENDRDIIGQEGGVLGDGDDRREIWRVAGTDKADLSRSIDEGAFIVRYLGHGIDHAWINAGKKDTLSADPPVNESFNIPDIENLNNNLKLPFVISAACNTGDITPFVSFAEKWQRDLKAVGIFAADEPTKSAWNDKITQRILNRIFCSYDRRAGIILNNAMMDLYNDFTGTGIINESFLIQMPRIYRYFGDPDTGLPVQRRNFFRVIFKNILYSFARLFGCNPMKFMDCLE